MTKENSFIQKVEENLSAEEKKISPRDYRFYLVDRFLKLSKLVHSYSSDCVECKHLEPKIEATSKNLAELINGSKTNKIIYERLNDKVIDHLSKKHNIKPKRYFTALYSVYGMVTGAVLGIATSFIITGGFSKIILVFLLFGLLIGNYLGARKDNFKRKNKLQY